SGAAGGRRRAPLLPRRSPLFPMTGPRWRCSSASTRLPQHSRQTVGTAPGVSTRNRRTPAAATQLHGDLAAELDDAARRNAEELRRRQRVAVHEIEHLPPEAAEPGMPAGHDVDPPDEKRGVHHIEDDLVRAAVFQQFRNIRVFHEAVTRANGVEIVAEMRGLDAVLRRNARYVFGHDV